MNATTNIHTLDIPTQQIQPKRMYAIRDRFVVVKMEASRWANSQTDHECKDTLASMTGADLSTFNVSKQKLAKEIVGRVSKFYSRARDLMRVPPGRADGSVKYDPLRFGVAHWDKGSVLVPVSRYVDMERQFNEISRGMKVEIDNMRSEWDKLVADTKVSMGTMYDPNVIPSFDEFAGCWGMSMTVMALPELDPRITLDNDQLKDVVNQVKQATCNRVVETLTAGWRNAAESLLTSLEYAAAVLGDDREKVNALNDPTASQPKAKTDRSVAISESLFENLGNQLSTCTALANTTQDQQLLALCARVQETLGNVSPQYLRDNYAERRKYAAATESLVAHARRTVETTKADIAVAVSELEAFA